MNAFKYGEKKFIFFHSIRRIHPTFTKLIKSTKIHMQTYSMNAFGP